MIYSKRFFYSDLLVVSLFLVVFSLAVFCGGTVEVLDQKQSLFVLPNIHMNAKNWSKIPSLLGNKPMGLFLKF